MRPHTVIVLIALLSAQLSCKPSSNHESQVQPAQESPTPATISSPAIDPKTPGATAKTIPSANPTDASSPRKLAGNGPSVASSSKSVPTPVASPEIDTTKPGATAVKLPAPAPAPMATASPTSADVTDYDLAVPTKLRQIVNSPSESAKKSGSAKPPPAGIRPGAETEKSQPARRKPQ